MGMSTDIARAFPDTAARLVAHPESNTLNAWDVLSDAVGHDAARLLVLDQDGGLEALTLIGEA